MAAQAAALQNRLDAIEASAAWRATLPLRTLGARVPLPLRRSLRASLRLVWRILTRKGMAGWPTRQIGCQPSGLQFHDHTNADTTAYTAVDEILLLASQSRPVALIIDNWWPQPDRDSGSIDTINMVETLIDLGFQVIFAVDLVPGPTAPRPDHLMRRGVHCLHPSDERAIRALLANQDIRPGLCILNRVYGGGRFLEEVQRSWAMPAIIFNPVDLHFLRLMREAQLQESAEGVAVANSTRRLEEQLVRETDATIVVSSEERRVLEALVPEAVIVELPLARAVRPPRTGFAARKGIGFIGGFSHAPNVDALRFFLGEIWPRLEAAADFQDCEFTIVGADLPSEIIKNCSGRVRYLGHLPDIAPWLESLRATVAPLRYGAGAKGKIATSLAAGVPCVTTSIGAEGMSLRDGIDILIADSPDDFASQICRIYRDPLLWVRVSKGAQAHVAEKRSMTLWRDRFEELLWTIGAMPTKEDAVSETERAPPHV